MHLVTRPSMLTLTVERLVGSNGHDRMTCSPESSDGSDSSRSPVTQPPSSASSLSPQHFTSHKISLLLSSGSHSDALDPERSPPPLHRFRSIEGNSPGQRSPARSPHNDTGHVVLEEPEREVNCGTESGHPNPMSPNAAASDFQGNSDSPRLLEGLGDNGDGERPPSVASGGSSSTSTWSNSWGSTYSSTGTSSNHNTPTSSKHLKFSIQNILRADFGQRAVTITHRPRPIVTPSLYSPNTSNNNERGRVTERRTAQKRHLSPRNISEDSNSSCASSSRREEVVDESKVNPEVPKGPLLWPAWVYCTRYSDRPSSGPRSRRVRKKSESSRSQDTASVIDEKRPRTAFTAEQLGKLKQEFEENRYLTEKRRQDLARDLKLNENQIKIWFQNKRAKLKKSTGQRGGLALQLMAQGLYNHSTVPMDEDEEDYLPC